MTLEGFYGTQKASPLFLIHGRPCISVTCWSCQCTACPHVSAHVTVRRHMRPKRRKEEEETLLPCPLIVFSVLSGSSPTLWEYPCIPGNRGGEGQQPLSHALTPDSGVWRLLLYPDSSWSLPSLPWCQLLLLSNSIIHHFPTCLLRFLPLLIRTNTRSSRTTTPSSFPPPGTFSSVYSPKLSFLTR